MTTAGSTLAEREPQVRRPRRKSAAIGVKRVYEKASAGDGVRILVDRLWPRGLSKTSLKYDAGPASFRPRTNYENGTATIRSAQRNFAAAIDANLLLIPMNSPHFAQ
jgi:hypothetical protein